MVLTPGQFGAVGDGEHDDGPHLNDMFDAASAMERADIDLTGTWYVGETVRMRAPQMSRIVAGSFHVLDAADLDVVLFVDLGQAAQVHGMLGVYGLKSSHLVNRNVDDGVHLHRANFCRFDGFDVRYLRRDGVRNAAQPGSNIIGANLGRIRASFCGAPGWPGAQHYTRASAIATSVERQGSAGSPVQTARIVLDTDLPLRVKDFVGIGGKLTEGGQLCEVTSVEPGAIEVYPWPGAIEGEGLWPVEGVIGAAVKLAGGNTTQVVIEGILASHCGHALHVSSLYGCIATAVTGEVVGSAITIAAKSSAVFGASVRGLHGEVTLADITVAGLNVQRTTVISPIQDVAPGGQGYHIKPRLNDGGPTAHPWPIIQIPPLPEE